MKRKERAAAELPEDIVENIITRLPLKFLMRFQCVCKAWRDRIRESRFASKYQKTLESQRGASAFLQQERAGFAIHTLMTADKASIKTVVGEEDIYIHYSDAPCYHGEWIVDVVGSCNGVVCLRESMLAEKRHRIALWNPTIRSFRIILDSSVPLLGELGFGYDAKADDYKIVWLQHRFTNESINLRSDGVKLYGLKSGSWKKVSGFRSNDALLIDSQLNVYTDGVYHWVNYNAVVSFDMTNETFTRTELPKSLISHFRDPKFRTITSSFKGCVAIIAYRPRDLVKVFSVWVLKEVGVEESWARELLLGRFRGIKSPLGFWNDEKMFMKTIKDELVVYDIRSQEFEKPGIYWDCSVTQLYGYSPSLVYIGGKAETEEGIFRDPWLPSLRKQSRLTV